MTDRCAACGLKEAPFYDDDGRCPLCIDRSRQNAASETETGGRKPTTENGHNLSRLQRAALEAISEHGSMRAAAKVLGTNHGVISMALDGHETDAAFKALGVPKTPPQYKRHRSHYEHGRGARGRDSKARVQAWLARNGWENLTEAVDELMERES